MRATRVGMLALALAASCESPSAQTRVRIQTDAPQYAVDARILYTVFNNGEGFVYLARCCDHPQVALDRRQGSAWTDYSSGACLAVCSMAPFAIPPHAGYLDTIVLGDTGTYRLRLGIAPSVAGQPDWLASNAFEVR